jgi:hypothetical protein
VGFLFTAAACTAPSTLAAPSVTATAEVKLPACASHLPISRPASTAGSAQVPVPGDPVGAVLCRYAGTGEQRPVGDLAGTAQETSHAQVAQLQSAINASKALHGTAMGCVQGNGDAAIVIVVYPQGTPARTISFARDCQALFEGFTEYQVSDAFAQLLVDQTGNWKPGTTHSSS